MEGCLKSIGDIFNEALAVYNVSYEYAMLKKEVKRCGFAWKIAGSALTRLYIIKQNEKALNCDPSVVREIFRL